MAEMILDIKTLPETIFSVFTTQKVNFSAGNGVITLTPFSDEKPRFDSFFGMFSGNGNAVDEFLEEKHKETELYI